MKQWETDDRKPLCFQETPARGAQQCSFLCRAGKKKIVFAIQAKCTGIWHLLISGWFYTALAKQPLTGKKNRNCICQEAEMYPKKTLEALQGVIPVQRTLWKQCGPGQCAAKQKGDTTSNHSTTEITTNTTHSYRSCPALSYTSKKKQKTVQKKMNKNMRQFPQTPTSQRLKQTLCI